jgi:hypothetical protein
VHVSACASWLLLLLALHHDPLAQWNVHGLALDALGAKHVENTRGGIAQADQVFVGLYLPVHAMGSLEKIAADQTMDALFLEVLAKFQTQGRNVSHNKSASTYAPAAFANDPKVAKAVEGRRCCRDAPARCGLDERAI